VIFSMVSVKLDKHMRIIPLTQGKVAIVDDGDFERLNQFKWHNQHGYAWRSQWINGKVVHFAMHREILGIEDRKVHVDHKNLNRLDNRRDNLRIAPKGGNAHNKRKLQRAIPGIRRCEFKGVHRQQNQKWYSVIYKDRRPYYLGNFDTPEQAALAYNAAAKKLHGEFALLNEVK
jgi:hypothetical protein